MKKSQLVHCYPAERCARILSHKSARLPGTKGSGIEGSFTDRDFAGGDSGCVPGFCFRPGSHGERTSLLRRV